MDGKCDEFKNYLHSSGAIKVLKEALTSVYRLENWPANPIDHICKNLPCEQNAIIASLTNEVKQLQKKVQYLRAIVPDEELNEVMHVEIKKSIENVNENSNGNEPKIVFEGPSEESEEETIQMVEDLFQRTSKEDKASDQISNQEDEQQNGINGPNSHSSEQESKKSEVLVKKPNNNRWNRKNRKHRN